MAAGQVKKAVATAVAAGCGCSVNRPGRGGEGANGGCGTRGGGLAALALKVRRPTHGPLLWWQPHLPSPPPLPLLLWCPPRSV